MTKRKGKRKQNYASSQIQTKRNAANKKSVEAAQAHANMLKERDEVANILSNIKSKDLESITSPKVLVHRKNRLGRAVTYYRG